MDEDIQIAREALGLWLESLNELEDLDLKMSEDGMIMAAFEKSVFLWIYAPEEGADFIVTTYIAPIPDDLDDRYQAFKALLRMNFSPQHTKGGALALDDGEENICLCYVLDINNFDGETLTGLLSFICDQTWQIRRTLGLPDDLSFGDRPNVDPVQDLRNIV